MFTANNMRWFRYTLNLTLENIQDSVPEPISASVGAMEQLLQKPRGVIEFPMAPESLLV